MLKDFLNFLPKELLILLLLSFTAIVAWFVRRGLEQVKKAIEKRDKELNSMFEKLDKKIDKINENVELDSEGTKASLYYNIDQLLNFAELFKIWSSQLKEAYEKMYKSYIKLGNGLDDGKTFESRASSMIVDDTKFYELISAYNKNRRKLFLDYLEERSKI